MLELKNSGNAKDLVPGAGTPLADGIEVAPGTEIVETEAVAGTAGVMGKKLVERMTVESVGRKDVAESRRGDAGMRVDEKTVVAG